MTGEPNTRAEFDMNVSYIPYDVASVTFKGQNFDLMFSFGILCYIDRSNNKIWRRIPEVIGNLKSLDVLNLSHNALIGPILQEFANLQQLQILDLLSNQLSRPISLKNSPHSLFFRH